MDVVWKFLLLGAFFVIAHKLFERWLDKHFVITKRGRDCRPRDAA